MNQPVLIFVGIAAVLFIILLILRNKKDKKEVIDQIKNDYPKSKDSEGDADIDNDSQMHWFSSIIYSNMPRIVETIPPESLLIIILLL